MSALLTWLRNRADNVAVGLLTAIFVLFVLQIVTRYVIRQPLGWTLEACLLCWLWLVFWSSAFILKERDHVRFSILSDAVGLRARMAFAALSALCLILAFGASLPATLSFVEFMAIEKTSLLKIRFDLVFSIYLVFAAAVIARALLRLLSVLRGRDPDGAA